MKAITLPNSTPYFVQTVAEGESATLKDCLSKDLAAITAVLNDHGQKPGKDGLPKPEFMEEARKSPGRFGGLSSLETYAARVPAIKAELAKREQAQAAARAEELSAAKARLQAVVDSAPSKAQTYIDMAEEAAPALARVRQFLEDAELVGSLKTLRQAHANLGKATLQAAHAVGVQAPQLPELPADTVTPDDVDTLAAFIFGNHGGWSQRANPGAHDVTAVLKKL